MKASILQPWPYEGRIPHDAECWLCHGKAECRHHVYPGNPNRRISEREGCWVYLCDSCHADVHAHGRRFFEGVGEVDLMRFLQEACQARWEHDRGSGHDGFRAVFGRSYL